MRPPTPNIRSRRYPRRDRSGAPARNAVRDRQIRLRRARRDDLPDIRRISGRVRRNDYVPPAFPRWIRDPRSYALVAESDGRVVAVTRARLVTPHEAWGQGIRVDPAWQGRGIGVAITRHWPDALYRRGARVARVAILGDNVGSKRMVAKSGFHIAARTIRRGWWGQPLRSGAASRSNGLSPRGTRVPVRRAPAAASQAETVSLTRARSGGALWRRIRLSPSLARNGYLVLSGDYYAALTRERVDRYVRRGDAYLAGPAFCLLDRRGIGLVPRPGWWIVALGGPPRAAARLAREVVRRAARRRIREVWVDAGPDRRLIHALEDEGFTAPSSWGEVVVMEARLPLAGSR
ncbi:MAG TPA: GNAT family N-acetyltransferase [bacterium]|nr:GNAT family N-acetyltransferase [bacterium]